MKFENRHTTVYCKDGSYKIELDNRDDNYRRFNLFNEILYYGGFLVHRENGPAIEQSTMAMYYLNGKNILKNEYLKIMNVKAKENILSII
jgi:hypothetical protein